jgi:hypothetical protein
MCLSPKMTPAQLAVAANKELQSMDLRLTLLLTLCLVGCIDADREAVDQCIAQDDRALAATQCWGSFSCKLTTDDLAHLNQVTRECYARVGHHG